MSYRLLPAKPGGHEVGEALHNLLEAFKNNELVGLAFVAMRRRGRYHTDCTGSCMTNPTLTRGALGELTDKVSMLQHTAHFEDTR